MGIATLIGNGWEPLKSFDLRPDFFCEKVWKSCDTNLYTVLPPEDYVERVLKDKPEIIKDDDFINKQYQAIAADTSARKTFKMVHITDAHFDLNYAVGADSQCSELNIICCRADVGFPTDPTRQARPTGEYHCDLPYHTIELMGDFINTEIKPDTVVWTGDITAHDIWKYTLEEVEAYTAKFGGWLQENFSG